MEQARIDAMLITGPENIRYISGFTGGTDGKLLVADRLVLFTDGRYEKQAQLECPDWELIKVASGLDGVAGVCDKFNRVGLESQHLSHHEYMELSALLNAAPVPLTGLIEGLRQVKDEAELDSMRRAAQIGDRVFARVCQMIEPGVTESHVANQIAYWLKEEGCSKEAFDTIAVSGENAALPHGRPGSRRVVPGDMLTLDFGGFYQGYASDMTRTVIIGQASNKLCDVYHKLLEAQEIGVSLIRAGIAAREVDRRVREILRKYALDDYFVHSTGHGVGLNVHEEPRLSSASDAVLQENMVVTVEPGVYIPGWGGIRIEDTVIVRKDGAEIITRSDKGLLIL